MRRKQNQSQAACAMAMARSEPVNRKWTDRGLSKLKQSGGVHDLSKALFNIHQLLLVFLHSLSVQEKHGAKSANASIGVEGRI